MAEAGERITSPRNPRVVEATKLRQRKHRQRQGRVLVEGAGIIELALAAGLRAREAFACREQWPGDRVAALAEALRQAGAVWREVTPEVLAHLSARQEPEGLVAVFDQPPLAVAPPGPGLVVVLDRLQDPGNVGTLIRTAEAVGAAVALFEPCCDPFDPKTIRGSMGAVFTVVLARFTDAGELAEWLARPLLAADLTGELWGETALRGSVALIIGHETRGLSPELGARITARVTLPIVGRTESLNAAVAGGVLMYQWLRSTDLGRQVS